MILASQWPFPSFTPVYWLTEKLNQCCINAGPSSPTLSHHWANVCLACCFHCCCHRQCVKSLIYVVVKTAYWHLDIDLNNPLPASGSYMRRQIKYFTATIRFGFYYIMLNLTNTYVPSVVLLSLPQLRSGYEPDLSWGNDKIISLLLWNIYHTS